MEDDALFAVAKIEKNLYPFSSELKIQNNRKPSL
jgi:hypothetical protein